MDILLVALLVLIVIAALPIATIFYVGINTILQIIAQALLFMALFAIIHSFTIKYKNDRKEDYKYAIIFSIVGFILLFISI